MTLLDTIVEKKRAEVALLPKVSRNIPVAERDFVTALRRKTAMPHLIAEIKPASPLKGRLLPEGIDIAKLARYLEQAKATALSVLTDESFFQGGFENLRLAAQATESVPLLCKDFIISEKQVQMARLNGADSFLLIAQILEVDELIGLLEEGRRFGMEALVEIADDNDLQKVLQTDAKLVGINNRDLRDFSVDLRRTFSLAKRLPSATTIVSLSGFSGADIRLVKNVAAAVLVGSNIGKELGAGFDQAAVREVLRRFTAPRPLIKFCGVRTVDDAAAAIELGVDLLGLNFVPTSRRQIADAVAEKICNRVFQRKNARFVGVFQDQPADYVQKMCSKYRLDFAQLSGDEQAVEFAQFPVPIIKGISIFRGSKYEAFAAEWGSRADVFLFDGKTPGSGVAFPHQLLPATDKPFLVAGGVNPENARLILKQTDADGVDTASGIEADDGLWSFARMEAMLRC